MTLERFVFRSAMPVPADAVFAWHCRPGALERLSPPWESIKLLERSGGVENGSRVVLAVHAGGCWRRWVAEHCDYEPGRQFCDVQSEGPFAHWRHCHRVVPDGSANCFLEDDIEYALPYGRLSTWLGGSLVRRKLERMFRYRHQITVSDLSLHQKYSGGQPMKIAVTGSTGLVGSALVPFLTSGGHQVVRLVRSSTASDDAVAWDPSLSQIDARRLEGVDAVVHLAGENIAVRRWNTAQKARIRDSRVQGTKLLCETLARLKYPPRVLVTASAIGFYGDRGDEELSEASPSGTGYLAEVCREWEAATEFSVGAGIRVVHLRFGVILSPRGGALATMLTPFRLGLGGRLGNGRQWMSWIALDDAVGSIYHALCSHHVRGPANAVAPNPVTNLEFTKTLGKVLGRPTILPMPGFMARAAFGEMADALLLASTKVLPRTLLDSDYSFLHPNLEGALRDVLGKASAPAANAQLAAT